VLVSCQCWTLDKPSIRSVGATVVVVLTCVFIGNYFNEKIINECFGWANVSILVVMLVFSPL
jgi:hypothetical protein